MTRIMKKIWFGFMMLMLAWNASRDGGDPARIKGDIAAQSPSGNSSALHPR